MPVQFTCPVCNHALSAPDRFAGKAIRCPQCKEQQRVPGPIEPELVEDDPPKITRRPASRNPLKKKVSPVAVFVVVGGILAVGLIGSQMDHRPRENPPAVSRSQQNSFDEVIVAEWLAHDEQARIAACSEWVTSWYRSKKLSLSDDRVQPEAKAVDSALCLFAKSNSAHIHARKARDAAFSFMDNIHAVSKER